MSRYTRIALRNDLDAINEELKGTGYYLAAQGRNGYTGLDEYKGDPSEGNAGKCIRNLQCGTVSNLMIKSDHRSKRSQRNV